MQTHVLPDEPMYLHNVLCQLGQLYPLSIRLNLANLRGEIDAHSKHWHPYNPRKPGYKRWGLSLTSLDGGLSGIPDLDSIKEFNQLNNTNYSELDFNCPTPALTQSPTLAPLFEAFAGELGRCHYLKFESGGYFPPHRDSYIFPPNCFRLFSVVAGDPAQYCFLLEGRQQALYPGRVYFFNSMLEHALFAYRGEVIWLVMNVRLSPKAVQAVLHNLEVT
ncbi:MAG: hypothetical protein IT288_06245 [Bdellovibrionales bacterium]|nr:hypothetical protein [Bdellovibrionales bacterium]